MRSSALRLRSNGLRVFGKRTHQFTDGFKSVGEFLGCELFVREGDFRHFRRVKNRMLNRRNHAAMFGGEFPAFDGGADGELPHLFTRPDAYFHVLRDQRGQGSNQRAKQRSYFWGY